MNNVIETEEIWKISIVINTAYMTKSGDFEVADSSCRFCRNGHFLGESPKNSSQITDPQ